MSPRKPAAELEGDGTTAPPSWAEVLEGIGAAAAYVRLYRVNAGRKEFVARVGLEVQPEAIQDGYGGGEYELNVCDVRGKPLRGGTYRLQVAGPPKLAPEAAAAVPRGAVFQAADIAPARDMHEAVRRLDDIYRELRNPPPPIATANPLELATGLVTAISAALVPVVTLFKDRQPRPRPGGAARDRADAFERGIRIGVSLGRGGSGSGWADKLMDIMGPAIQNASNGHPGAEPAAALLPAPSASSAVPVDLRAALAQYLPQLIRLATEGKDPSLYAELVADNAPPELLDALVQQIARGEDFRRELFQTFPQAVPYREWLTEFLGAIWTVVTTAEGPEGAELGGADVPGNTGAAGG